MPVTLQDMPAERANASTGLAQLVGSATRLVLASLPRPGAAPAREVVAALRPKELVMALLGAVARSEGLPVQLANPHATAVADWDPGLTVTHFCGIDLACPLPVACNILLLDGEDLLALAEEQRLEPESGLYRQCIGVMNSLVSAAPLGIAAAHLLGRNPQALQLAWLLARGVPLLDEAMLAPSGGRAGLSQPLQWMACDLDGGHYNFLQLKRHPKLGTSQARVLLDASLRGGAGALVAFATPATLPELGPALRAFAALQAGAAGAKAGRRFFVFFFGSYDAFAAALTAWPDALFFGDNFHCPAIRFLFAPFAPSDVLAAIRGASAVIDGCYGGVLDALGRGLGIRNRIVLGPDSAADASCDGATQMQDIAWAEILAPASLTRRRHKANRSRERRLAELLEMIL
jgi:hypothetical protein